MIVLAFTFSLIILLLVAHSNRTKANISPKITEQPKETDELITVILPIISNDR